MEWKRIKKEWELLGASIAGFWGKSLEELLAGMSAKYKGLTGISWLNVHRLYDFRRFRLVRFKLFQWRKKVNWFTHKNSLATK